MAKRSSWDEYFMDIAEKVAARATCDRKHVGAVFVGKDKNILSTGYNGSIAKAGHCDEIGHDMEHDSTGGHCVRTIHAEINAIVMAARHGVRLRGATLYVTTCPCWHCFKAIANLGTKRIVFRDDYRKDARMFDAARELEIRMDRV